jgi:UDP-glucose 4-epimerase
MIMATILVTGASGYIGSHTVLELLNKGYNVVGVDNFSNSSYESLKRVQEITGKTITFYEADIRDEKKMEEIFQTHTIDAVIHFAAFKAVGESCKLPLKYYENNISGTVALLRIMGQYGVKKIIFSSSATVYGDPERLPLDENCRLSTTNPYGSTKLMMEMIMQDLYKADNEWNVILLRYFNPVGAHESGRIGEDPKGIPNNLMPFVAQVASGKLSCINVFGNDYDTPDGTGVRDYIHVVDLALGHIAAIEQCTQNGVHIYNLGTGHGYSVLDMIKAFEKACGKTLPYKICDRRPGDIAACYACPDKAKAELKWEAKFGIEEMCATQWKWQSGNPRGYEE